MADTETVFVNVADMDEVRSVLAALGLEPTTERLWAFVARAVRQEVYRERKRQADVKAARAWLQGRR